MSRPALRPTHGFSGALFAVFLLSACPGPSDGGAGDGGPSDGGAADAGAGTDGGGSGADAGNPADGGGPDAGDGDSDAGGPAPGFGGLSGDCGFAAGELANPSPSLFVNAIDFGDDPYTEGVDYDFLTAGGQEVIDDGNAGGGSLLSEVFAYEVLARCEQANLLKTENEIDYAIEGKITDLLVDIDNQRVGVSVVRAVGFPREDPYTVMQAQTILEDKLSDILESTANVHPDDAWVKQILHVIAYADMHADSISTAWDGLDAQTKADTIVVVTVTDGDDGPLY